METSKQQRALVKEKEERTGKETRLGKREKEPQEGKERTKKRGKGKETQEPHPHIGEEIKRPPAGQPSAGHRRRRTAKRRQKAKPLAEAERTTAKLTISCLVFRWFEHAKTHL